MVPTSAALVGQRGHLLENSQDETSGVARGPQLFHRRTAVTKKPGAETRVVEKPTGFTSGPEKTRDPERPEVNKQRLRQQERTTHIAGIPG